MSWQGILFGLASALSWGAGDFSGGMAARRSLVYQVVLISQLVGLALLAALALVLSEQLPPTSAFLWAAGAGLAGGLGLLALYRGLAIGPMGVVAPVAAIVSAASPVLFGAWTEGWPATQQISGFAVALFAVWLVSQSGSGGRIRPASVVLPAVAGLGFGLFLILIDHVSETAILWPLATARGSAVILLLPIFGFNRRRVASAPLPLLWIGLAGILDAGGNAFYALAARAGRLDVAAVLSSLYPAITVLLARLVSKELVSSRQWLGVAAALAAVLLITL